MSLPALLLLNSIKKSDNNKFLFSTLSDNNILLVKQSTRIYYEPNKYSIITHHMALSTIIQNKIREPFSYNKTI